MKKCECRGHSRGSDDVFRCNDCGKDLDEFTKERRARSRNFYPSDIRSDGFYACVMVRTDDDDLLDLKDAYNLGYKQGDGNVWSRNRMLRWDK